MNERSSERAITLLGGKANGTYALLAYAIIVLTFLFACRVVIQVEAMDRSGAASLVTAALRAVSRFGMDAFAVCVVVAASFLLSRISPRMGLFLMVACSTVLVGLGAANVRVVGLFNQPLSIALLEFAGIGDHRALPTIAGYMSRADRVLVGAAAVVVAVFAVVPRLARTKTLSSRFARRTMLVIASCTFLAAPVLWLRSDQTARIQSANAAWWLLKSIVASNSGRRASVANPDHAEPFATVVTANRAIAERDEGRTGVRNVILVVMESVGAHYLDPIGKPDRTPRLSALLRHGAYFPNAYAGAPSSWSSLISLMNGVYPPIASAVDGKQVRAMPSLLDELSAHGMRVGVFTAADWAYSDLADFHSIRREDQMNIGPGAECGAGGNAGPAAADACKFETMKRWIAQSDQPYFALIWTDSTHYPYGAGQASATSSPSANLRRYLAAVTDTDAMIGQLFDQLAVQGMLEETLVVVVGDHGEAFGQHGNQVHGNDVYDESVRVPLFLLNSRLFSGTTHSEPVRLLDVPATILAILGRPSPPNFQGVDLTGPTRPERVYFAAPWLNISLGYVENTRKYNYLFDKDELERFDLSANPGEAPGHQLQLSAIQKRRVQTRLMNWKTVVDASYARP